MVWSVLQSAGNSSGSANPVATYGTNLSAKSKLIAFAINSGGNVTAVADGSGNSFSKITTITDSGNDNITIWVLDTLSSQVGTKPTITATCSAPGNGTSMVISEVSGLALGNTAVACYDGTAGTGSASGVSGTFTPTFGSYTSKVANEFLIAVSMDSGDAGSTTTGPAAPYNAMAGNQNGGSASNVNVYYKNTVGGVESQGTWSITCSTSNGYGTVLVAFNPIPTVLIQTPSQIPRARPVLMVSNAGWRGAGHSL